MKNATRVRSPSAKFCGRDATLADNMGRSKPGALTSTFMAARLA